MWLAYRDFIDLKRRTASDNILRDKYKRLILSKILNMVDIKEDLLLWFINFLIKKFMGGGVNKQLAKE